MLVRLMEVGLEGNDDAVIGDVTFLGGPSANIRSVPWCGAGFGEHVPRASGGLHPTGGALIDLGEQHAPGTSMLQSFRAHGTPG